MICWHCWRRLDNAEITDNFKSIVVADGSYACIKHCQDKVVWKSRRMVGGGYCSIFWISKTESETRLHCMRFFTYIHLDLLKFLIFFVAYCKEAATNRDKTCPQKLLVRFHPNFTGIISTKSSFAYPHHFPVQWLLSELWPFNDFIESIRGRLPKLTLILLELKVICLCH